MAKRGRKPKEECIVNNFDYWFFTLQNQDTIEQFLNRGDNRQINEIYLFFKQLQGTDERLFKKYEGQRWFPLFDKKRIKQTILSKALPEIIEDYNDNAEIKIVPIKRKRGRPRKIV